MPGDCEASASAQLAAEHGAKELLDRLHRRVQQLECEAQAAVNDDLQPWEPAGVRPFRVGDRVRVRLSPECDFCVSFADGAVGTVSPVALSPSFLPGGHSVGVRFDEPFVFPDGIWVWSAFAPTELELIEPWQENSSS